MSFSKEDVATVGRRVGTHRKKRQGDWPCLMSGSAKTLTTVFPGGRETHETAGEQDYGGRLRDARRSIRTGYKVKNTGRILIRQAGIIRKTGLSAFHIEVPVDRPAVGLKFERVGSFPAKVELHAVNAGRLWRGSSERKLFLF